MTVTVTGVKKFFFLVHQIRVLLAVRKTARQKSSDIVIAMLKWHRHFMSLLSVFRIFEAFL